MDAQAKKISGDTKAATPTVGAAARPHDQRRRVPRRPIFRRIGLLVAGVYNLAHAHEIGEGGMMIESPVPLKEGTRVVISFRIPGVLQGVMLSRVVYVLQPKKAGDPVKYGVQFDKVDFEVKRKIRNYVASNVTAINAV
jgi:hypothetical protein